MKLASLVLLISLLVSLFVARYLHAKLPANARQVEVLSMRILDLKSGEIGVEYKIFAKDEPELESVQFTEFTSNTLAGIYTTLQAEAIAATANRESKR